LTVKSLRLTENGSGSVEEVCMLCCGTISAQASNGAPSGKLSTNTTSSRILLSIMITCAKVLGVGVDTHQPQYNKSTGYFESYQEFIIVNIMNS